MTRACVTRLLAAATLAAPPSDHPAPPGNFGDRSQRLLNERAVATVSTDNNCMVIFENRPAGLEPPPQPDTF